MGYIMVEIDTITVMVGAAGFLIGFVLGKMNGNKNNSHVGDIMKGNANKAGGNINTGTNVGGNLAQDKSKQNN